MALPFSVPNVYLKRPVYYTAVHNSPPAELLQSNSCLRAASLFRILPNRASPGLQSFSISRLPPDVDRRLHLHHRHLDADRRPGLARSIELSQLALPARPRRLPRRHPDLPVLAGRRRDRRPHRPPPRAARLAVRADGVPPSCSPSWSASTSSRSGTFCASPSSPASRRRSADPPTRR